MSMEVKTVMQDTPEKFRPLAGEIVPPRCTEKVLKWGVPGSRGNGLVWGPGPTGCSTDRRGCGARSSIDRTFCRGGPMCPPFFRDLGTPEKRSGTAPVKGMPQPAPYTVFYR